MYQGIWTIVNYRIAPPVYDDDVDFLNEWNNLFGRFEALSNSPAVKSVPHQDEKALCLDIAEVRRSLRSLNSQKAPGRDNIPGRVLRECADQLPCVLMDIFNTSLDHTKVPSCFKTATIIPVPKKPQITSLNDYQPIALTPIMMKCFERLVKEHIASGSLPRFTPSSFPTGQTTPLRMPSPPLFTWALHIWRRKTLIFGCCSWT